MWIKVLTRALAWCFPQKATYSSSKSLCLVGWLGQEPYAAQACARITLSFESLITLPRHDLHSTPLLIKSHRRPKIAMDSTAFVFDLLLLRLSVPATSRKHVCFPSCVCPHLSVLTQTHSFTFFLDLPPKTTPKQFTENIGEP